MDPTDSLPPYITIPFRIVNYFSRLREAQEIGTTRSSFMQLMGGYVLSAVFEKLPTVVRETGEMYSKIVYIGRLLLDCSQQRKRLQRSYTAIRKGMQFYSCADLKIEKGRLTVYHFPIFFWLDRYQETWLRFKARQLICTIQRGFKSWISCAWQGIVLTQRLVELVQAHSLSQSSHVSEVFLNTSITLQAYKDNGLRRDLEQSKGMIQKYLRSVGYTFTVDEIIQEVTKITKPAAYVTPGERSKVLRIQNPTTLNYSPYPLLQYSGNQLLLLN